jgi:hypothetical protein
MLPKSSGWRGDRGGLVSKFYTSLLMGHVLVAVLFGKKIRKERI